MFKELTNFLSKWCWKANFFNFLWWGENKSLIFFTREDSQFTVWNLVLTAENIVEGGC